MTKKKSLSFPPPIRPFEGGSIGNPELQSFLLAHFHKGGEKEKRFLTAFEMTRESVRNETR